MVILFFCLRNERWGLVWICTLWVGLHHPAGVLCLAPPLLYVFYFSVIYLYTVPDITGKRETGGKCTLSTFVWTIWIQAGRIVLFWSIFVDLYGIRNSEACFSSLMQRMAEGRLSHNPTAMRAWYGTAPNFSPPHLRINKSSAAHVRRRADPPTRVLLELRCRSHEHPTPFEDGHISMIIHFS